MFVSKAGACPSGASFRCTILVRLLPLPANIRLGWRGLAVANTLVYL